jgi:hypothetical protein
MNTTEYEPPATTHPILPILFVRACAHSLSLGVIISNGGRVYGFEKHAYVVGLEKKSHKDIGLELYMPMDCIMLRLIERDNDRRWYTIPLNTPRTGDNTYEAIREFLITNRALMECMWHELPQPIAEELIHFFFW